MLHVWYHFSFKHHFALAILHKKKKTRSILLSSCTRSFETAYSGIGVIDCGTCTTYVLIICLVHQLSKSYKHFTQYKYNNTLQLYFAPYVKMYVPVSVTARIFTRLGMKTKLPCGVWGNCYLCNVCRLQCTPRQKEPHLCVTCVGDVGVLQVPGGQGAGLVSLFH